MEGINIAIKEYSNFSTSNSVDFIKPLFMNLLHNFRSLSECLQISEPRLSSSRYHKSSYFRYISIVLWYKIFFFSSAFISKIKIRFLNLWITSRLSHYFQKRVLFIIYLFIFKKTRRPEKREETTQTAQTHTHTDLFTFVTTRFIIDY